MRMGKISQDNAVLFGCTSSVLLKDFKKKKKKTIWWESLHKTQRILKYPLVLLPSGLVCNQPGRCWQQVKKKNYGREQHI